MSDLDLFSQAYWDERYAGHAHVWSGHANSQLVARVQALTPGRTVDVGCGEGGDAIWLARQGWSVTGVDVSPVGLEKAQAHAQRAGVQITWRQVDLYAPEMEPLGTRSTWPSPACGPTRPEMFYTADDLVPRFAPDEWEILAADAAARAASDREGQSVTVHDTVLFARRLG